MQKLGERIRHVRGRMSQEAFAGLLGISKGALGGYERGENCPNADVILTICKKCRINVDAARQNSPGECVITSGTSDCMRCKKIAKAGQVPAFFVSPVVVWGMAGLACAGA